MRLNALLLVVLSASSLAAPMRPETLPAPLREWVPWVLHDVPTATCPFLHGGDERECSWPGRLTLTLDERGGRFTQTFKIYGPVDWIPLPGGAARWPQQVFVDGRPAVVIENDAMPAVLLGEGDHTVSGTFEWDSMPEALMLPKDTGLISLTVKGKPVFSPNRDSDGRVFLQRESVEQESDRVDLDVHRLVTDDIPLTLVTRLSLKVSGRSREVEFGRALPDGFTPLSLTSGLPVRVEPDGHLRVQVRPGAWTIELTARSQGPVSALGRPDAKGTWLEGEEVWAFEARPSLRQVLVEGVNAVDPTQTTLPANWRAFPSYLVGPTDVMKLTERRRGDADPAPDVLTLNRTLWLDFDGQGFTANDKIGGQLHRSWRLDVQPGVELGRVVTTGADQTITRLGDGRAGVELREGALTLEADSRFSAQGPISAVSWDADFNRAQIALQVPPGWRLISARGADSVPNTWVDQWTLFDLFVVLISAVALARLFGVTWGVVGLVALTLGWQENDVPQFSWLVVLALEGLVRVLPTGKLRSLVTLTRLAAWAALAIITVAFAVQHVRHGMYPALARSQQLGGMQSYADYSLENLAQYQRSSLGTFDSQNEGWAGGADAYDQEEQQPPAQVQKEQKLVSKKNRARDYDKNATVQTGPGLPRWTWNTIAINFTGPVQRDQQLSFFFLSPAVNLVLAFVRVALLGLLLLAVLGFPGGFWPSFLKRASKAGAVASLVTVMLALPALAGGGDEPEKPAPEVLEELKARLLEGPACGASCASIPRLLLEASPNLLRLRLEVLSGAETAVPLPGNVRQWAPETVLLDGKPSNGLRRQADGSLWLALGPGAHQVVLEGALPQRDTVQIALPLRAYRVDAKLDGWTLDGLHEDGVADVDLQLSRKATNEKGQAAALQTGTLPPFVRVERTLVLGLEWEVSTTVVRVSPTGSAVVLEVPLLPGESVTSSEVRVVAGKALVNMPASETQVSWGSVLETKPSLSLTAPAGLPWTEVWRLDVGRVWHVTLGGIPVVHQQDASGARLPEWRPWPGETVTIDIARPEALGGQTLTVDQSRLSVSPGARANDVTFTANFRSSRGGLHAFTLPDGATLQSVSINGSQQPIRQEGRTVNVPLVPGSQGVELKWRESEELGFAWTTPQLDVGTPTVNAELEVHMPQNRWVLFVRGTGSGPAVLFWSFLLVLLAVSIGLARTKLTVLSTTSWVLLALGLSQVPIVAIAFVFGWLLFLGWREKTDGLTTGLFNLRQLALVGVTGVALIILAVSVYEGLLGAPSMQVSGNGSSASLLRWFMDRTSAALPTATVISVPMLVYRGAMLAWSLWMALSLVRWLKWGWKAFSTGGLWKSPPPPSPAPGPPAA